MAMELPALGIDVGKKTVHAAVLVGTRKRNKTFTNDDAGFTNLLAWLREHHFERVHACLESTGGWSEALATALADAGHVVSIVNPARVKAFGKTELIRTKNDRVDAALIARFCAMHRPSAWTPPAPKVRLLQGLARRRDALIGMRTQEQARLQSPGLENPITESIEQLIATLESQIREIERQIQSLIDDDPDLRAKRELLTSIEGIGEVTAQTFLAEIPNLEQFRNIKAVGAYLGLSPREHQSGLSAGRSRLSKLGNARLRHALYWPAIVAMRHNAAIRRFSQRLLAAGKPRMVVIAAAMRKLACLAYAVVRSGRPFDATRLA
jgi:transposase